MTAACPPPFFFLKLTHHVGFGSVSFVKGLGSVLWFLGRRRRHTVEHPTPTLLGVRSESNPLVLTPSSSVPTFPHFCFCRFCSTTSLPLLPRFLCLSSAGSPSITSSLLGPGEKVLRLVWDSRAKGRMGPISLTPVCSDTLCLSAGGCECLVG